jgi:protein-S-isoprenylcysteine O-methyltransferase Ste14
VTKLILLSIFWIAYLAVHSLLAADRVKSFIAFISGKYFHWYRIFYNTIALAGLFAILLYSATIPSDALFESTGINRYAGLMLATVGIFIIKAAFKQYNLKSFVGMEADLQEGFKAEGILTHIRHPLYTATILIVIGYCLFAPVVTSFISAACIFIYLPIGIWLEERKLIEKFGTQYEEYCKNVPALIPKITLGKAL